MNKRLLSLLLLLAWVPETLARSKGIEVTPENIAHLYRPFLLNCQPEVDGTLMFRLALPARQASPERRCSLFISTEPVDASPVRDSTYVNGELIMVGEHTRVQPVLARCDLFETICDDTLRFEARIGREILDKAAIIFIEYGRASFDQYSFSLRKFAKHE